MMLLYRRLVGIVSCQIITLDWDFDSHLRRLQLALPPTLPAFYATKISFP